MGAGKSALKGFAGIFAVGAVVKGLQSVVAEAREAQKVGALTEQAIKSMGNVAGISAKQVGKLATSISNKTGIDDEAIQSGSNLLLSFGKVRNEAGKGNQVFSRATQAAADLSVRGFGSIDSAAKGLGKALNDPIKGIGALSKAGVQFSDKQKATIKRMVESGNVLGAQKIIMREVEMQVGGAAAASATAGEKMKNAWNNAKESLGTALLPAIDKLQVAITTKIIPAIVKFIGFLQKNPTIVMAFGIAIAAIAAAFVIAFIAANALVIGIGLLVAAIVTAGIWIWQNQEKIKQAFIGAWNAIKKFLSGIWTEIKQELTTAWNAIKGFFRGVWNGIKAVFWGVVNGIVNFVRGKWNAIKTFTSTAWNAIKEKIRTTINAAKTAVSDKIKDIIRFFKELPGKAKTALGNLKDTLVKKGKDLVQGFINGIKAAPGKIKAALLSLLPGPLKKFAGKLGLASPSKLFKQWGEWTVEGYVQGIDRKRRTVTPAMTRLANSAILPPAGFAAPRLGDVRPAARSTGPTSVSLVGAEIAVGKDGLMQFVKGQLVLHDQQGAMTARFATP